MDRAKKRVKADVRGRAMAWLFLVCALLASLLLLTLRAEFYSEYWRNPTDVPLRIASEDMGRLFEAIPRALNGDLDALRLRVHDLEGREGPAFSEREIAHMADVTHLYHLAKVVLAVSALALMGLALWSWRNGRLAAIAKGALLGTLDVFVLIGAVALWAMIDFRSAFWAFHHIAFTNDLWLLNPETDLLIQMMPQGFFEQAAARLGLYWALCAAAWCAGWGIALYHRKKKTEQGSFD